MPRELENAMRSGCCGREDMHGKRRSPFEEVIRHSQCDLMSSRGQMSERKDQLVGWLTMPQYSWGHAANCLPQVPIRPAFDIDALCVKGRDGSWKANAAILAALPLNCPGQRHGNI